MVPPDCEAGAATPEPLTSLVKTKLEAPETPSQVSLTLVSLSTAALNEPGAESMVIGVAAAAAPFCAGEPFTALTE